MDPTKSNEHARLVRSGLALMGGLALLTLSACSHLERPATPQQAKATEVFDTAFFQDCAFVCADIQPDVREGEYVIPKTAKFALRSGYATLCIHDATFNAFESTRVRDIRETGYTHILTADEFAEFVDTRRY